MSTQKKSTESVPAIVEWFKLGNQLKREGFNIKQVPVKTTNGDWEIRDDSIVFTPAFHIYASKTARVNSAAAKADEFQKQIDEKEALIENAHATKQELDELQEIYEGMQFDENDIESIALKTAKETEIKSLQGKLGNYEEFLKVYTEHVDGLKALQKPFLEELEVAQAIEIPTAQTYPLA